MRTAGIILLALVFLSASAWAQDACGPDNPELTMTQCVNNCESGCEAEPLTVGFFTSFFYAVDKIEAVCKCDPSWGPKSKYVKCVKRHVKIFREIWKQLKKIGEAEGTEAAELQEWATFMINEC